VHLATNSINMALLTEGLCVLQRVLTLLLRST
jgi:hypothetical protein